MKNLVIVRIAAVIVAGSFAMLAQSSAAPRLSMKINGQEWVALPTTVFGANGVAGLAATAVVVSGGEDQMESRGLTINLFEFKGPGAYTCDVKTEMTKFVVQFHDGNSKEVFQARYLVANNQAGETFTVNITKASGLDIEGTFAGTLTSDDGKKKLVITEGVFDTE